MFQLSKQEFAALMSQIATSNAGRGGRRKLPYAFTEHGAIVQLVNAIRDLMAPPEPKRKRPIGFGSWEEKK